MLFLKNEFREAKSTRTFVQLPLAFFADSDGQEFANLLQEQGNFGLIFRNKWQRIEAPKQKTVSFVSRVLDRSRNCKLFLEF